MNRKETAQLVRSLLDRYIPSPEIPLKHDSAYTLLIAVLLSAQCTDERVNKVAPRLFAQANVPEKMVELGAKEIEEIIRPCGLAPTKSRAIWNLSKQLIEKYDGKVPSSFEALEALPGVGHKTASVVLVQAFDIPAFPVDTHIHRCAKRWNLSSATNVKKTESDLKKLFPQSQWGKIHLQMILFARTYCPARTHKKDLCPICSAIS